jgi:hypothetical protein
VEGEDKKEDRKDSVSKWTRGREIKDSLFERKE